MNDPEVILWNPPKSGVDVLTVHAGPGGAQLARLTQGQMWTLPRALAPVLAGAGAIVTAAAAASSGKPSATTPLGALMGALTGKPPSPAQLCPGGTVKVRTAVKTHDPVTNADVWYVALQLQYAPRQATPFYIAPAGAPITSIKGAVPLPAALKTWTIPSPDPDRPEDTLGWINSCANDGVFLPQFLQGVPQTLAPSSSSSKQALASAAAAMLAATGSAKKAGPGAGTCTGPTCDGADGGGAGAAGPSCVVQVQVGSPMGQAVLAAVFITPLVLIAFFIMWMVHLFETHPKYDVSNFASRGGGGQGA
jgi:hypothetical protein